MGNPLKKAIKERRVAIGSAITVADRASAEVMASAGFDWLVIDMERGVVDFKRLYRLLHTVDFGESVSLVRILDRPAGNVTRAVNIGSCGVVAPMVRTAEDAAQAVKATKYPPLGARWVGPDMPLDFEGDLVSYTSQANDSTVVLVEVDDTIAIENLERIVTVAELDGVVLDLQALASSMGLDTDSSHPVMRDAEQRVLETTQKAGIVPGVVIAHPSPEEFIRLLKEGFLLVLYGTDMGFLAQACRETVQHLRLALSEMVGN